MGLTKILQSMLLGIVGIDHINYEECRMSNVRKLLTYEDQWQMTDQDEALKRFEQEETYTPILIGMAEGKGVSWMSIAMTLVFEDMLMGTKMEHLIQKSVKDMPTGQKSIFKSDEDYAKFEELMNEMGTPWIVHVIFEHNPELMKGTILEVLHVL